ncbi:hypothetical protein V1525DRAFT_384867 [Lipomyces kononenkoae]|uniref:Uncharacterized protein n=1 Tax=Lipomyces kononenkoae TaxID=34357 RepID=A0ACC3TDE4_LIPKO
MATIGLPSKSAGFSLESLRKAALQSRSKQRPPSVSKAAASAFEQDSEVSDDELARRIRSERTPSPDGQANESFDSISTSLSILDPKVQADAVAALSDLSRAGLSYQDLLTYGRINAQFLSMLVSSVSLPSSSPATETSKRADTSMSSPAQKSDVFIPDRDVLSGGEKALAELSSAGLSCNDMVELGGLHPLFLAQLISQMSSSLQNHAQLLEQAMVIVREAAATLSAAPTSMPSSGAATPTPSISVTSVTSAPAQPQAPSKNMKTEMTNGGKLGSSTSAISSDTQQSVIAASSTAQLLNNRSSLQSSVSISGISVNVSRTLRKRPTALDLDATSNQNVKFGSDRSNGKMVIEMSDSDDSEAEGAKK